jgi:hypothetical protein
MGQFVKENARIFHRRFGEKLKNQSYISATETFGWILNATVESYDVLEHLIPRNKEKLGPSWALPLGC